MLLELFASEIEREGERLSILSSINICGRDIEGEANFVLARHIFIIFLFSYFK